jgi:hypothetical protein
MYNIIQVKQANTDILSGMVEGTKFRIFRFGTYVWKDAAEHEICTRGNNDSPWMSDTT